MIRGEEGKLLARAAGFIHPGGANGRTDPIVFCSATSFCDAKKETLRIVRRSLHSAALPSG
jgi:hypothetical protein